MSHLAISRSIDELFSDAPPKVSFCSSCGRQAHYACDWRTPEGRCGVPLCQHHRLEVALDKHLCPLHQKAWREWMKRRDRAAEQMRLW